MTWRWDLLLLNLIAPGLGQFRARHWWRGAVFLTLTLAALAWTAAEALGPLIVNVWMLLQDAPGNDQLRQIHYLRLGLALLLTAVIWLWSFVDLVLFPPARGSAEGNPRPDSGQRLPPQPECDHGP